MAWNGGVRYSTAGGATRGADCLGEDWQGMAGVARRALVRPGAERIGLSRQAGQGGATSGREWHGEAGKAGRGDVRSGEARQAGRR